MARRRRTPLDRPASTAVAPRVPRHARRRDGLRPAGAGDAEAGAGRRSRAAARPRRRDRLDRRLRRLGLPDRRERDGGDRAHAPRDRRGHHVLRQRVGVPRGPCRGGDGQGPRRLVVARPCLPHDEGLRARLRRGEEADRREPEAAAHRPCRPPAVPRDPVRRRPGADLRPGEGRPEGRARGAQGRQAALPRLLRPPRPADPRADDPHAARVGHGADAAQHPRRALSSRSRASCCRCAGRRASPPSG